MANELRHLTVGADLTQAEYEAVGGHVFNSQATGDIMYASSATQLSRLGIGGAGTILTSDGSTPVWATKVFINETLNAKMTVGLTINQGANDDEIIALKSSDIAHGMTTLTETDTFGRIIKQDGDKGGLHILGYKMTGSTTPSAVTISGTSDTAADTTKSTAARGLVELFGAIKSGTSWGAVNADGNVLVVRSYSTGVMILDEDGDLWLNGGISLGGVTPLGYLRNYFGGDWTSDGAGTEAATFTVGGRLTGHSGDSNFLAGAYLTSLFTLAGNTGVVAQLYLNEPTITLGGNTVTEAASIYIASVPSEGTTNAAIIAKLGDMKFLGSVDSALVADQVALGGYEIGGGNRVLAISQETAVAVEVDETKFSHKLQVRINGSTYFMMLTAT